MDGKTYLLMALVLALSFLLRFILVYLKAKQELIETETEQQIYKRAPELIAEAEEAYGMVEKAGEQKMRMCIESLLPLIPDAVAGIFTGDVIQRMVQTVFDSVKEFAEYNLDKAAEKAAGKEPDK